MATARKIVLHSLHGYRPELDAIVAQWIREQVKYVGVVGVDASRIEDIIDELCIGDGSSPYFMVTAFHDQSESVHTSSAVRGQNFDRLVGGSQQTQPLGGRSTGGLPRSCCVTS